ncbi:MAG: hypothetical protein Kow00114_30960 [Kiloniellaceae bacterium]
MRLGKRAFRHIGAFQDILDLASVVSTPLGGLILMPLRLVQTLWAMRVLIHEPWRDYGRTSPRRTLNCAWHRAYGVFIDRYGREGFAYPIGLGIDLSTLFHITRLSATAYWKGEALLPWASMLAAAGLILVIPGAELWFRAAVAGLTLFSVAFYYVAFEGLKYDALAWLAVPLGYAALMSGNESLFALVFLYITFTSVTVSVVQGFVWFVFVLSAGAPLAVLAFVPGGLKLLAHLRFLTRPGGITALRGIMTGIGLTEEGAEARKLRPRRRHVHLMVLWFAFAVLLTALERDQVPLQFLLLAFLPPVLMLINTTWRRFADEQTIVAVAVFAFPVTVIAVAQPWWLAGLWIALTASPRMFSFYVPRRQRSIFAPPPRRPYRLRPLAEACEAFLATVPERSRVLFHCAVSGGRHPTFDGYRALKEYLHLRLAERETGLLPDFYLFFEHMGGRLDIEALLGDGSPAARRAQVAALGGTHLILPSADPEVPAPWIAAGFVPEATLDCGALEERGLLERNSYNRKKPYLFLLRACDAPSLCEGGALTEMAPNRIAVRLGDSGVALVKFLWSGRFVAEGGAVAAAAPGAVPWLQVTAKPGTEAVIRFR